MNNTHRFGHRLRKIASGAVWRCTALALFGVALAAGPPMAHAAPAWTASPALVAQLGPEVKIVTPGLGTYGIRPPRGFRLRQVNMSNLMVGGGKSVITIWMGPMQTDQTAANFQVIIGKDNNFMFPGPNAASFVRQEMSARAHTHLNPQMTAIQQGTIHGMPFAHATWKGMGARTGKMFAGLFYGEWSRSLVIMIEAKDEAPSSQTSMPLFNASALTLHKL